MCKILLYTYTKKEVFIMSKEKVLETLSKEGAPMNAGQIAEKSGLDRKVVDKAMAELKKEEKIVSPKRCYWEPAK
jgi:predicted ArsR family transcriptional regulator